MRPDEVPPNAYELRTVDDPLQGRELRASWVNPGKLPVTDEPKRVINWDFYDGAIVMIAIRSASRFSIEGTGVMIGPGLVLTATHTLREHEQQIIDRQEQIWCIGIRSDRRAEAWKLRDWVWPETKSDISMLNVELRTEIPDDWTCSCLQMTARVPQVGETFSVLGFQFDSPENSTHPAAINEVPVLGQGHLYVVNGRVTQLWEEKRDTVMVPFPAIELNCGTRGGMSGGPVLDANGDVVGLLSTNFSGQDGEGPSYAAWIAHAFMFEPTIVWPPDLYPANTPLIQTPEDLIHIVGRERFELIENQEVSDDSDEDTPTDG